MLFKRKIYDKFLAWKTECAGKKALLKFREKYKIRIGGCYIIHPRNLIVNDDILCIPPYMTICL